MKLAAIAVACASLQAASIATEVKIDQVGYLPGSPKVAMVLQSPGGYHAGKDFFVHRANDGVVAFKGLLGPVILDPDTGDYVQQADFSELKENGTFYVEMPGLGKSWNFKIAPDVFARTYYLAVRSYYGQRCGTAVDLGPEFDGYRHGTCHTEGAYDPSSGKEGKSSSSHGWHDAGDYGRYVVNSGISTATLLWTWELFGKQIKSISLNLPESGHGTPDILNEARWNIDWMLMMQDSDGGVWHKQTSNHFCGFIMPEADKLTSLVVGSGQKPFKTSCSTADFAAVTAIAARVYQPFDAAYARRCLLASERAWNWLISNPDVLFHNPSGISTGEYGDKQCGDEKLWAAAELLRTTSKTVYETYFSQHYSEYLQNVSAVTPPSWAMMAPFALWSYVLGETKNEKIRQEIVRQTMQAADQMVDRSQKHAYRLTMTTKDYIWGSNGVAANYSLQLLIANRLHADQRYSTAALDNLHYLLGRNTFGLSWVTQTGSRSVQHIHHRLSAADGIALPWPGLLAGGPNPGRQDNEMKRALPADVLPGKAYVDVEGAYACNEVAINWNAPLVFALAAFLPQ